MAGSSDGAPGTAVVGAGGIVGALVDGVGLLVVVGPAVGVTTGSFDEPLSSRDTRNPPPPSSTSAPMMMPMSSGVLLDFLPEGPPGGWKAGGA